MPWLSHGIPLGSLIITAASGKTELLLAQVVFVLNSVCEKLIYEKGFPFFDLYVRLFTFHFSCCPYDEKSRVRERYREKGDIWLGNRISSVVLSLRILKRRLIVLSLGFSNQSCMNRRILRLCCISIRTTTRMQAKSKLFKGKRKRCTQKKMKLGFSVCTSMMQSVMKRESDFKQQQW